MAADFTYPTNAQLSKIAQDKMPNLLADRLGFKLFPMVPKSSHIVEWEQLDNFLGLQQVRGLNGQPGRVKKTGASRYAMRPGIYGEFETIDEEELTTRRSIGDPLSPVDLSELVMIAQDKLLGKRLDRIESIIWTLLTTGTFSVSDATGAVLHTDTFAVQTFSATHAWSDPALSTPLADARAIQLLHRGHSVRFDRSSEWAMNRKMINRALANANANDLYGRRTTGLATINDIDELNSIMMKNDLPTFLCYDEGYLDDSGTFQPFIADGVGVVIGKRPQGQTVGEYLMTRNANNPNAAPGPYMKIIDRGELQVPRDIEIHDGHNGGPAILFPSAVVATAM